LASLLIVADTVGVVSSCEFAALRKTDTEFALEVGVAVTGVAMVGSVLVNWVSIFPAVCELDVGLGLEIAVVLGRVDVVEVGAAKAAATSRLKVKGCNMFINWNSQVRAGERIHFGSCSRHR
jgi:hypothetical protein